MSDDPIFPCQCGLDDECSRECEVQVKMEEAKPHYDRGYDAAIKDVLTFLGQRWNLGKDNLDSYTLAFLILAIERGEAKGAGE